MAEEPLHLAQMPDEVIVGECGTLVVLDILTYQEARIRFEPQ